MKRERKMGRIAKRHYVERMFKSAFAISVLVGTACAWGQTSVPWVIGPFARPASGNPVVTPDASSTFQDPLAKAPVSWEALHTFNPAAIVRHGKIYVLYRAEDNSGAMEI